MKLYDGRVYVDNFLALQTNKLSSGIPQPAFTGSKLTIETLEQGVKYVQS